MSLQASLVSFISGHPLIAVLILLIAFYAYSNRRRLILPAGPIGIPVLGYFPFLGREPQKALIELSKKWGSVFT